MAKYRVSQRVSTIFITEVEADSEFEARNMIDSDGLEWLCESDLTDTSDILVELID